jgi:hypothetical protein
MSWASRLVQQKLGGQLGQLGKFGDRVIQQFIGDLSCTNTFVGTISAEFSKLWLRERDPNVFLGLTRTLKQRRDSVSSVVAPIRRNPLMLSYVARKHFKQLCFGYDVVSPLDAQLVSYDMLAEPTEICPLLRVRNGEEIVKYIKAKGLTNEGAEYSGVAIPTFFGQHFYVKGGHIATVSGLASRLRVPKSTILHALRHPELFVLLWTAAVTCGGVSIAWSNVPRLLNGGFLDALVTQDPTRLQDFKKVKSGFGNIVYSVLARTRRGHALAGSALHILAVIDDEHIVYLVIGGGGHPFATPADINNWVAMSDCCGLWTGTIRNMRKMLREEKLVRELVQLVQHGDYKAVAEIAIQYKNPDSLFARTLNDLGAPVRGVSRMIGDWKDEEVKGSGTRD